MFHLNHVLSVIKPYLVLEAELERLLGDIMVEPLHAHVGPEELEALAVRLPEELDPRHQDLAVRAILGVLAGHRAQHDHLRGGQVLEVIDLKDVTKVRD